MGAWIETIRDEKYKVLGRSHPMWVRGLKLEPLTAPPSNDDVAPHVGAWIETPVTGRLEETPRVAPHVGAWIETALLNTAGGLITSHPMWVRGLKLLSTLALRFILGRTPCGCVD